MESKRSCFLFSQKGEPCHLRGSELSFAALQKLTFRHNSPQQERLLGVLNDCVGGAAVLSEAAGGGHELQHPWARSVAERTLAAAALALGVVSYARFPQKCQSYGFCIKVFGTLWTDFCPAQDEKRMSLPSFQRINSIQCYQFRWLRILSFSSSSFFFPHSCFDASVKD